MSEVDDFEAMLVWLSKQEDVPCNGPEWATALLALVERLRPLIKRAPAPVRRQLVHFARCANEIAVYEAGAQKIVLQHLSAFLKGASK